VPDEDELFDLDAAPARVSRRTVLKGLGAAGVAAGLAGWPAASAVSARGRATHGVWRGFDAAVEREFARMGLVGAAVAVVSAERVLHTRTFGVRDLHTRRPVTNSTHFLVGSTTKSMSSLLVATFVDEGKLQWDQRVIDAWPGFRAPTDELTGTLRVRDLLGMDSGIGEPPAVSGLHEGDPTAMQLLQSIVNLPVINRPGQEYFYNNTVYAVGGYLPALEQGVGGDQLAAAYANQMHSRVYGPVGMRGARVADDPRGLVRDYSRGHGLDLSGRRITLAYGPVGSYAPVGGTLATLDDMAAYVRLQLRRGVSVSGRRVVSAANLVECWKPHIGVPLSAELDPDAVSSGYGMGWINARYRDGTSLISHTGGIDGFASFIGFLPEHDIGLVVLNSINPAPIGPLLFYLYVLNVLLSQRFGLNVGVPAKVHHAYKAAMSELRKLGRRSRPVNPRAVAPFLGYYEGGYRLVLHNRDLRILLGPRVMPLRAMTDGGYIISGGLLVETRVRLDRDRDGVRRMELVGLETVRRTVGLD
jgi:CubicO group peptidase (beta-lactamase class C family)